MHQYCDRCCCSVSLCLSVTRLRLRRAKTAAQMDVLFGVENPGGTRNFVLTAGPDSVREGAGFARCAEKWGVDSMWPSLNHFDNLLFATRR